VADENDQRKLQELLMQIQTYQKALQDYARQGSLTERAIIELMSTIQAIEELPKSKETEALIPIGPSIFIKANLLDKENVIFGVGAGAHITKTAAEAKKYLEERKSKLEEADKMLREEAGRLSQELELANQSAEELYSNLQK
jgi:prefoldin alpha subunit